MASVLPAGYREVLHELRGAFVLAMVTTLSVAALPGIIKATANLLAKKQFKSHKVRADQRYFGPGLW